VVRVSDDLLTSDLEVRLTLGSGGQILAPFVISQDAARPLAKALIEACEAGEKLRRRYDPLRALSRDPTKPEAEACRYRAEGIEWAMSCLGMESLLRSEEE